MTISNKVISERVRILREVRNITAKDLAIKIGMQPRSYGYYEEGKWRFDGEILAKIKNILNIEFDYFFVDEDKANKMIKDEITNQFSINCKKEELQQLLNVISILDRISEAKLDKELEDSLFKIIGNLPQKILKHN
jgi:transcriptional regulator with XRE-family HTH domain